jgi:hypothetical protein
MIQRFHRALACAVTSAVLLLVAASAVHATPPERAAMSRPLTKRQIGRVFTLGFCHYDSDADSFALLFNADQEWICRELPNGQPGSCGWDFAAPCPITDQYAARPAATHYSVRPNLYGEESVWGWDHVWTSGSAAHGVQSVECQRSSATTCNDDLIKAYFIGNRSGMFEIDGGIVQHTRPAVVSAVVDIAHAGYYPGSNDLTIAIQIMDDDGAWFDAVQQTYTSELADRVYTLQTLVDPGNAVRLQVRSSGVAYEYSYALHDAMLYVETCIPDESNPGHCSE